MRLERYPAEKLKKEILEIVGKHLDLKKYRVFFFGSRVEGKGTDRSEISVGIESYTYKTVPPERMSRIEREIENIPTLYKIEIMDFKKLPEFFREIGLRHAESLLP